MALPHCDKDEQLSQPPQRPGPAHDQERRHVTSQVQYIKSKCMVRSIVVTYPNTCHEETQTIYVFFPFRKTEYSSLHMHTRLHQYTSLYSLYFTFTTCSSSSRVQERVYEEACDGARQMGTGRAAWQKKKALQRIKKFAFLAKLKKTPRIQCIQRVCVCYIVHLSAKASMYATAVYVHAPYT